PRARGEGGRELIDQGRVGSRFGPGPSGFPTTTGGTAMSAREQPPDPVGRLDDPDFPALTMSQAAELLGVQAAFLRSLDTSGVLQPSRSPGGHRRYSRPQLP